MNISRHPVILRDGEGNMATREEKLRRKIEKIIYDSGWVEGSPNTTVQGVGEQIYATCITGAFVDLFERIDWFFKWLITVEPDLQGYIYQEWLRSDPPCTGSRMRKLLE